MYWNTGFKVKYVLFLCLFLAGWDSVCWRWGMNEREGRMNDGWKSRPHVTTHTPFLPDHCLQSGPDLCRWPERSSSPRPGFPPSQRRVQSLQEPAEEDHHKQTDVNPPTAFLTVLILYNIRGDLAADRPGCFCLGLGRLVTQVWGHIRTLQGCREPSKNSCLVSDRWIPPRGVLGRVLAGTNAKQNTPTLWMLSIACRKRGIVLSGEV